MLDTRGTGRHAIRYIERRDPLHDNRPGSIVPLFVPGGAGGLKVASSSGASCSTTNLAHPSTRT